MTHFSKMKKHPIDELFNQKLNNYRVEPSKDLKERFLKQLEEQPEKKAAFTPLRWYFAAAASIAIMVAVGWSFYASSLDDSTQGATLSQMTPPAPSTSLEENNTKESNKLELVTSEPEAKPNMQLAIVKPSEKVKITETPSLVEKPDYIAPVSATGVSEIDELIPDELTLALQASEAEKKQTRRTEEVEGIFRKSAGETIIIVASDFEKEEKIYLPQINSDSPITLTEATDIAEGRNNSEKSLLAKVFKEIKHLKHGEKIGFDEIDQGLAMTYDEDTFIGHEAMEFRERFRWVKEKLSKDE